MEGTRNERVVLIIISYVIGFVTGLILFGINIDVSTTNNTQTKTVNEVTQNTTSGRYSFLCESIHQQDPYCYGFIYDNITNTKHEITIDQEPISMSHTVVSRVKLSNSGLVIGSELRSIDGNKPWIITNTSQ